MFLRTKFLCEIPSYGTIISITVIPVLLNYEPQNNDASLIFCSYRSEVTPCNAVDPADQDVSRAGGSGPLISVMSLLRYIAGFSKVDLVSWHQVQIVFDWTSLFHCEQAQNNGWFRLDHFRTLVLIKLSRHAELPFSYAFQEHDGMIKRPRLPEAMAGSLLWFPLVTNN